MQQSIDAFEKSVKNVDSKINKVEWMIRELDKAALTSGQDSAMELISSSRQIKTMYEVIKKEDEEDKTQQENVKNALEIVTLNLFKQFEDLKNKVGLSDT